MKPTNIKNILAFFSPRSIAVIGASTREESVGRALFSNILLSGYTGIVYPVNPKARGILGVRAYRTVWDIPESVDLAVIIVPNQHVPAVMEDCGEKGVKGAIIITAGFKEIGKEGSNLEKSVIKISKKYNISVIGPNCLGIINTDSKISLNATFVSGKLKSGNIAFISQSGALGVAALEYAREKNIGLSKFVSIGNKADVTENDLLVALKDDPHTDVILLYIEDLNDPKGFIELARELTGNNQKRKPILVIKSGRTVEGARAASSHTGALGSSDEAYDSLFNQCGVIRVDTIEELFNYALTFASQPLPQGNKIGIVTNAGGFGIIATDVAVRYGLNLAAFSPKTKKKLKECLPITANISNPVDIIGDAKEERYTAALENVLADENVDSVIVIATPPPMISLKGIISAITMVILKQSKPVVVCCMQVSDISDSLKILEDKKIPYYQFPEAAARSLATLSNHAQWLRRIKTEVKKFKDINKSKVKEIISQAKKEKRHFLPEPEAHEILRAYGFPTLPYRLARDEQDCLKAAAEVEYPLAIKIVSPDILHKVDVNGVKINIKNKDELIKGYKEIIQSVTNNKPKAKIWGVLIQAMAKKGKETIIGMNRDPHFGPMLMFGLGGVYVEALKDVTFRIAPIKALSAHHMIKNIRGYKILEGVRGEKPSDTDTLAECLQRLSQLATDFEDIVELDINPLIVHEQGDGAKVVDARILIR